MKKLSSLSVFFFFLPRETAGKGWKEKKGKKKRKRHTDFLIKDESNKDKGNTNKIINDYYCTSIHHGSMHVHCKLTLSLSHLTAREWKEEITYHAMSY